MTGLQQVVKNKKGSSILKNLPIVHLHFFPFIMTEPLGNETILHIRVGEDTLVVKVRGIDAAELGDVVKIKFNINTLCLFDPLKQNRIL